MLFAGETHRGLGAEWYIAPPHPQADSLVRQLRCSRLVAQLLGTRGIVDGELAGQFLSPKLSDLHDPALLPGCDAAAERIIQAARQGKRIALYADYDVDGLTSLSILWHALGHAGAKTSYYIPNRLDEGYGLNESAIRHLVSDADGPRAEMILTMDCGITAVKEVRLARELGAEVIVSDHHEFDEHALPEALLVHPRLPGSTYPNPNLCGAGVAFKLAWQIGRKLAGAAKVSPAFREYLHMATALAAMGTVADVVPLTGENRVLASFGLRALPTTTHVGLSAFVESCGLKKDKLRAHDIGFVLGPRINAAGRMGNAGLAAELLLCTDNARARQIAAELESHNRQRQSVERELVARARQMVEAQQWNAEQNRAIVVAGDDWHPGVIGLVASRLSNEFCCPAVVITLGNEQDGKVNGSRIGHGSCRSIEGFDVAEALAACGEFLEGHGGHPMAAGLRVRADRIDAFREAFACLARKQIRRSELVRRLDVDGVMRLADLTAASVEDLSRLEPFGAGNRKPLFATELLDLAGEPRVVGARGQVLQFDLMQDGVVRKAVCFRGAEWRDELCEHRKARVVFEPTLNSYSGTPLAELIVQDVAFE